MRASSSPFTVAIRNLPAWVGGLPLLTWARLKGTAISSVGAETGIGAWCGSAYDSVRRQVLLNGGGHGDGSDNGVYAIELGLDVPAPVMLKAGSPSVQIDVSYYEDGTPSSRHTYWHLQFVRSLDGMMQVGGAAMYGTGNYGDAKINRFRLSTNTWDPAGTFADRGASGLAAEGVCQDADENIYVWHADSYSVYKWVPGVPGTWSMFADVAGQWNRAMEFDSNRGRILCFGWEEAAKRISLAGEVADVVFTGSRADVAYAQGVAWSFCPERDSFLGIEHGGTDVYELHAETFAVEPLPIAGIPPEPGGGGHSAYHNRWRVCPDLGIIYLHPGDGTADLWVIRYQ